jgi:predicted ATP-grasp superfamily ATP-dependent carboligase
MQYALIIDSFRSHNALAYVCFTKNVIPIHIFSSKKLFTEQFSSVTSSFFARAIIYETPEQFLQEIEEYKEQIKFVFNCTDESHHLKNTIDNLLRLNNRHDPKFALARTNKFFLYKALEQPASFHNFLSFVNEHNQCIIKPADISKSGGCLDVSFVNRDTCTLDYKEDCFISPFFEGDEYAVDLVSANGRHKLVSVWKYIRTDADKVWKDRVVLMPYEENPELVNKIYNTVTTWLDKLNHKYGPVHLEMKVNGGQTFCIEINFRLNGHMNYTAVSRALENNQIDLTLNCYTTEDKFNGDLIYYKSMGYVSRVYLLNTKERMFNDVPWSQMEKIPSVTMIYKHSWPWTPLKISDKTYQGTTGIAILFNKDPAVLLEDEKKLKVLFD